MRRSRQISFTPNRITYCYYLSRAPLVLHKGWDNQEVLRAGTVLLVLLGYALIRK